MSVSNKTFLYFAYGSNLLTKRIHFQNPSAVFRDAAKLDGYKLEFRLPSKVNNIESWWVGQVMKARYFRGGVGVRQPSPSLSRTPCTGAFGSWTCSTWKPSTIRRASITGSMRGSGSRYEEESRYSQY